MTLANSDDVALTGLATTSHCMKNVAPGVCKCIDRIRDGSINLLMANSETNQFLHVTPSAAEVNNRVILLMGFGNLGLCKAPFGQGPPYGKSQNMVLRFMIARGWRPRPPFAGPPSRKMVDVVPSGSGPLEASARLAAAVSLDAARVGCRAGSFSECQQSVHSTAASWGGARKEHSGRAGS